MTAKEEWKDIQDRLTRNWPKISKLMPTEEYDMGINKKRMFYQAILACKRRLKSEAVGVAV